MKFIADVKVMGNALMVQTTQRIALADGKYDIDINLPGTKRSLDQNAMLWGVISELSKKLYGDLSEKETIYTQLLEMSGAKYEFIKVQKRVVEEKALEALGIRYYKIIKENNDDNTYILQVFYGSSTFNTKEMTQLIETTLKYASNCGVDVDENYWRGIINNGVNDEIHKT